MKKKKKSKEVKIIEKFISKLVNNSKDIDPEIAQIVNKEFWTLLW